MSDAKSHAHTSHAAHEKAAAETPAVVATPQGMAPAAGTMESMKVERPGSKAAQRKKTDETKPGGEYVIDATIDPETGDLIHGKYVNAEGEVLRTIEDGEEVEPEEAPAPKKAGKK